jgi:hypothetical protein
VSGSPTLVPSTPSPPRKRQRIVTPFSPGELGKFAYRAAASLAQSGWNAFVIQEQQPKSVHTHLPPSVHPAAPYLSRLARHGVPAPSLNPPWSAARRLLAHRRGPHPSASRLFPDFLLQDMAEMVNMGYWTVLPFSAVQHLPHLALAPAGVVPQRERRPRPIMDYTYNQVNQDGAPFAPYLAMQFGQALQRIVQRIVYANPAFGPVLLAKLDLADGYYRIPLAPHAAQQLAVVLPPDQTRHNLIGIPLSLPMGWSQSPPYFCSFTETCADIANTALQHHSALAPHPAERYTQIHPLPTTMTSQASQQPWQATPPSQPLSYVDIYIDDFLLAAQQRHLTRTMRSALHAISTVFRDDPNSPRRPVISASKLQKGDASWATNKRILGWDINTEQLTIALPAHRRKRLQSMLEPLLHQSRVSRRKWQVILGELRSMVPAIHSSKYNFSILQQALVDQRNTRIRLSALVKAALTDWLQVATVLEQNPAPLTLLVPAAPEAVGASDACAEGMGGFWLPTSLHTKPFQHFVWRARFPSHLAHRLVSAQNPRGTVTNSDLELASFIVGHAILPPCTNRPTHTLCATDNTPTQAWITKGSPTSNDAKALLLHHFGRLSRDANLAARACFTPGSTNTLADFCSRAWHLDDAEFLAAVNCRFPMQSSWTLVRPQKETLLPVILSLSHRLPPREYPSPGAMATTLPGTFGKISATPYARIPPWLTLTTPSHCCASSLIDTDPVPWLPPVIASDLEQWKMPYVPWGRRSPHWAALTPESNHPESWICDSVVFSRPTAKTMTHRPGLNQSHCQSSIMPLLSATYKTPPKAWPLQTCSYSVSSSSCDQGSMPIAHRQNPPHSDYKTSTSSAIINASVTPQHPSPTCKPLPPSPSNLRIRKTGYEANSWGYAVPITQHCAQSSLSSTDYCTTGYTAHHQICTSTTTSPAPVGRPLTPQPLPQPCAMPPTSLGPTTALPHKISPPGPCVPQVPWPFFAPQWTPTSSAY